jgi:dTDP-glucose 4,6-dehydratase
MKVVVTGGAGFIGSAVIRKGIAERGASVLNIDKLTYAANLSNLADVEGNDAYAFAQVDICDEGALRDAIFAFEPDAILHLAAESHVDRSIDGPGEFIQTNIVGTFTLLKVAREYYESLSGAKADGFGILHVSTDEVYGSLGSEGLFAEETPYAPNSPYSASKASSDHLARAWLHTYGLPVMISNCSNNYGPFQFPEKLIPLISLNGMAGAALPVYGDGSNIRDWLYVDDHADALWTIMEKGKTGEKYLIGGRSEKTNLEIVKCICSILDDRLPALDQGTRESLIEYVTDRPGHDFRYAIDSSKIEAELGWKPKETFDGGLASTVDWYLSRRDWWEPLLSEYQGQRLGLKGP